MEVKEKSLIHTIFLLNLAAVLIPVILIVILLFTYISHEFIEKAKWDSQIYMDSLEKNIMQLKEQPELFLKYIKTLDEQENLTYDELYDALDQQMEMTQIFDKIEKISESGSVEMIYPYDLKTLGTLRNGEVYFLVPMIENQIQWFDPEIRTDGNMMYMTVVIKMKSGYMVGYINSERFNQLTNQFTNDKGEYKIAITDKYGVYITNENLGKVVQRNQESHFDEIIKIVSGQIQSAKLSYANKEYLVTARVVKDSQWILISYRQYALITEQLIDILTMIIGSVVVIIIISVIIIILVKNKTNKWMGIFTDELGQIAMPGSKMIVTKRKYSELNTIAAQFNIMAQNIRMRDARLSNLAYTDKLTGLKNRNYLYDVEMPQIEKNKEKRSAIIIDLDDFKGINDFYGHQVGDALLIAVADLIVNAVHSKDQVVRLGADEFLVFMGGHLNQVELQNTVDRLHSMLHEPLVIQEINLLVRASFGVAVMPKDATTVIELIQNADTAINAAKSKGKNQICYYSQELRVLLNRQKSIENGFKEALEKEEFSVYYQIQIDNQTKDIIGFEALIRWNSEKLGFISPLEFIYIAERTGFVIELGYWIFEKACLSQIQLSKKFQYPYIMAINISAIQLQQEDFVERIEFLARKCGVSFESIELEITESVFIETTALAIRKMEQLKTLGFRIALDDFGTGYSSLSYLQMLPLDIIKIDRSFIIDFETNPKKETLLKTIIQLSHDLACKVVVEGIETQSQYLGVKALQADISQGFKFGKPLPRMMLEAYIPEYQNKKESI